MRVKKEVFKEKLGKMVRIFCVIIFYVIKDYFLINVIYMYIIV